MEYPFALPLSLIPFITSEFLICFIVNWSAFFFFCLTLLTPSITSPLLPQDFPSYLWVSASVSSRCLLKPLGWHLCNYNKISLIVSPVVKKHLNKYSTSLIIKEMQIIRTLRLYLTSITMINISITRDNTCWQQCGTRGTLFHFWWKWKLRQRIWKSIWPFLKN